MSSGSRGRAAVIQSDIIFVRMMGREGAGPIRSRFDRVIALPQFANSVQRMVEVLIDKAGKIEKIELRPTDSRFDKNGKIDLRHAAEAMAIILGGSAPKQVDENVLDIRSTLNSRERERQTKWRIYPSLKKLILADVRGGAGCRNCAFVHPLYPIRNRPKLLE